MDTLAAWHAYVEGREPATLDALLADDVVFRSPAVHTPQQGGAITAKYLAAAMVVLGTEAFRYVGEWRGDRSAVLEFRTAVDGLEVHGVDLIGWGEDGRITTFMVMIRPLKALNAVVARMGEALAGGTRRR